MKLSGLLVSFLATVTWAGAVVTSGIAADSSYSPAVPPRPVMLLDYYHRTPKQTRIGQHLLTGSYSDTVGRYRTEDFSHTNSYDAFLDALERDFDIRVHETPLVASNLNGADIVVLINPEKPTPQVPVPVLSEQEITSLIAFVDRGGTLVALLNSVGAKGTEEFETEKMRTLMRAFGLDWNDVNTEYSDITIGARHDYFYDIPVFHYGAGCTIRILDHAQQPQVLLNVKEDNGAAEVRGPGIVLVRHGRGKFLCVGDTGSWGGGNISRPWAENRKFLSQLFAYAKASRDIVPPLPPAKKPLRYAVRLGELNVIPTGNPLAAVEQPGMERYVPRPRTGIPYLEAEGVVDVERTDTDDNGGHRYEITPREFSFFQKPSHLSDADKTVVQTTRQGSLIEVQASSNLARRLAPDLIALFAFIPNDAIRVGDRWTKQLPLRLNPIRGNEPALTRSADTEMVYLRDETMDERSCRVFRTQANVWLSDIVAKIEDLMPLEELRHADGTQFEFMAGRGGRILFKCEQWIDASTGVVLKAETQSRLLAWLHRKGETLPVKTAQKDDLMMVSLASTASFTAKN